MPETRIEDIPLTFRYSYREDSIYPRLDIQRGHGSAMVINEAEASLPINALAKFMYDVRNPR